MIIKSLSRKSTSFHQLIGYFNKSENSLEPLTHNMYANPNDWWEVAEELIANSTHLPIRSNGVALYHEIISLDGTADLPLDSQVKMLQDIL